LLAKSHQFNPDEEAVLEAKMASLNRDELGSKLTHFKTSLGFDDNNLKILVDNKIIVKSGGDEWIPTLAGWLMFANNPQSIRSLKNAAIVFQQFRGTTREEQLKKQEINGSLPHQVQEAIELVLQNVWKIPKIQGIRREDIPAYDEVTLREVIINSVVHRDYRQLHQPVKIAMFADRLEIENPGGLLPGLTPLNLIHKREWRNPAIANLMERFGLGEMDGQGIDRIYMATRRLKVPAPQFIDDKKSFKVILSAPKEFENYSPEEKKLTVLILLIIVGFSIENFCILILFMFCVLYCPEKLGTPIKFFNDCLFPNVKFLSLILR
jgi:predicted HTH transcriptional regulator